MRTVREEGSTLVIESKPTGYWLLSVPLFLAPAVLPYLSSLVFGEVIWETFLFGFVLAGVGAVILATTRNVETRVDRGRQVITSHRRTLWGATEQREYPFADLRAVDVVAIPGRYTTGYRLELRMAGDETVLLAGNHEADALPGELHALAKRINQSAARNGAAGDQAPRRQARSAGRQEER